MAGRKRVSDAEANDVEAATRGVTTAVIDDDDLLPEARPEELPPETGHAVPKPIPVRYTVVREGEEGTLDLELHGGQEVSVPYRAGDVLVEEGGLVVPFASATFNRHYRVVQGEDAESAYEERFPRFSTGGTAYVRAACPNCDQTMIFSVEVGETLTMGDKSQLKPTFKAKAKEHFCGQTSAKLEDLEDEPDVPAVDGDGAADVGDDDADD